MINTSTEAYISYAHKNEKAKEVKDNLKKYASVRNIRLIIDLDQIGYKDNIQRFMEELAAGQHIIVLFNDAYFKSESCMSELVMIWKKGKKDYEKCTYPILTDDCKPFNDRRIQV